MPNPNSLPWMHYQDLQIPDISLQQQFYSYILNGNFNQALLLLNNNEQQLLGKAYIAKTINIISNALFQLGDYYYEGVLVFLSEKANLWYNLINNLNQTGNWNNQTQYQINNFTVYNNEIYGIYGLAVKKEFRCKGIGKEIIKQQLKICSDRKLKLALFQRQDEYYSGDMYRKLGFKDVSIEYYYIKKEI